jgi:hypothetical protein
MIQLILYKTDNQYFKLIILRILSKKMIFNKRIIFLFFFLATANMVLAQPINPVDSIVLTSSKSFAIIATEVQIDQLGNIYVISATNSIEKFNQEGVLLTRYSQNTMGQITQIDVSNPMQILVFYEDFQKVIFLDRNLTYLSKVELQDLGIGWVKKVAMSADGNIWIYDEITMKLQKYATEDSKLLYESVLLSRESDVPPSANVLIEQNNQIYLGDFRQGIFVFDQFATSLRFLPIKNLVSFSFWERWLIYLDDKNVLHGENLLSFKGLERSLPKVEGSFYKVLGNKLVLITSNNVLIQQIGL